MLRLELTHITKQYPAVRANDAVNLRVKPGEIHAVLGENGAGKSTLMKIIYGAVLPDAGEIRWNGEAVKIRNPHEARRLGISMVFQHFSLFDTLTAAENVWLGLDKSSTLAAVTQRITKVAHDYGLDVDPLRPVHSLSVGERQRVEIVRALMGRPQLLILDEPTSVLTPQEADEVLGLLRDMAVGGKLTILMISHKFREVMKFADEVTILRRGRWVGGGKVADLTPEAMARMMVGEDPAKANQQRNDRAMGDVVLEIRGLCAVDDLGTPAVVVAADGDTRQLARAHGQPRRARALAAAHRGEYDLVDRPPQDTRRAREDLGGAGDVQGLGTFEADDQHAAHWQKIDHSCPNCQSPARGKWDVEKKGRCPCPSRSECFCSRT
jgi:ABC-type uncharacterized transport system ATPase subunit